jgi:hypothetical protein
VINLDTSGGEGTHWTAARAVGGTLYYADPFGTLLSGWPPAELEQIYDRRHQVVSRVTFQQPKGDLCGYYAACFALVMDCITTPIPRETLEQALYESIST